MLDYKTIIAPEKISNLPMSALKTSGHTNQLVCHYYSSSPGLLHFSPVICFVFNVSSGFEVGQGRTFVF
jgi:hypothetical protein